MAFKSRMITKILQILDYITYMGLIRHCMQYVKGTA